MRVLVGYEPREALSFNLAMASARKRGFDATPVVGLMSHKVEVVGVVLVPLVVLLHRPQNHRRLDRGRRRR